MVGCVSCGVFGMKTNMQEKYYELFDIIYFGIKDKRLKNLIAPTMVLEELTAYLIAVTNGFKIYDVLPHDLLVKNGLDTTANKMKYTHMCFNSKFKNKKYYDKSQFLFDTLHEYLNKISNKKKKKLKNTRGEPRY